jgi:orotate phosphoribosyltransferase
MSISGKEVVSLLYDSGLIKIFPKDNQEGWILHSGKWSPFYIQLRPMFSKPNCKELMDLIGDAMTALISREINCTTKLAGIASAGIPISVIISYKSGIPLCYTRKIKNIRNLEDLNKYLKKESEKEPSDSEYGEHSPLEGDLNNGDEILMIDDIVTSGESVKIAERIIESESLKNQKNVRCNKVAVVVDREQGGSNELKTLGFDVYSLVPFKSQGIYWLEDRLNNQEFELIVDYLMDDSKYQDEAVRRAVLKSWRL